MIEVTGGLLRENNSYCNENIWKGWSEWYVPSQTDRVQEQITYDLQNEDAEIAKRTIDLSVSCDVNNKLVELHSYDYFRFHHLIYLSKMSIIDFSHE